MWGLGKHDPHSMLEQLYSELVQECRHTAPGSRLSYTLRHRLEKLTIEQRKTIVNRPYEGCAPLFISCKRGNVEIVEYLIQHCQADIEQRGVFEVMDDRSIHYVSPLWCASVAGKLEVVKCLVKYGADVNSESDTGSTPARSACFMTHLEIVMFLVENGANILKPNYNGGTCLINSVQSVPLCEFLLKHGANVNAQDIQLKTALHYAIQEHRFEMTKLLLDYGADPFIKNRYGDDALQTACLRGASQIFKYLIDKLDYSEERIAEAYELLGSTYLDEHFDLSLTLSHWRNALKIRMSENGKNAKQCSHILPNPAYLNAREFTTLEELNAASNDLDAMRMQSLLISERILGSMHKEMIYRLMYRGAAYADGLQYLRCIELWKYAFILRIRKDSLLHNEAAFAAQALVRLFLDLNDKINMGYIREELRYEDIYDTTNLIVSQFESCKELLKVKPIFKKHYENFDKILKILTHLIFLLNLNSYSPEQKFSTLSLLAQIRQIDPRNSNGDTLLHLVVSKTNTMKTAMGGMEETYSSVFPDYDVCKLMLKAGFYVDLVNCSQETPLHIVSSHQNFNAEIVYLLLSYGAHIDQKDITGNQPCKRLAAISKCSMNPLRYITLKCLAASKIKAYNLPFHGIVPKHLEEFVNTH